MSPQLIQEFDRDLSRGRLRNLAEDVEGKIYLIRGRRVILDRDLAKMYGVSCAKGHKI